MITAKEANKISHKTKMIGLPEAIEQIEQAMNNGQFSVYFSRPLNSYATGKLRKAGFKVGVEYVTDLLKIGWDDYDLNSRN